MDCKESQLATFAGGCFWCMVKPFDEIPGIIKVVSGYTGGTLVNPTYEDVCAKATGHYEAVQITFDPVIFPYEKLLEIYWQQIDPTNSVGQFSDRGQPYKTAIFYHNLDQQREAFESKKVLEESGRFEDPIVTEILPATTFYPAEEYHQDFHRKNPLRYGAYRQGSGRDAFLKEHWNSELVQRKLNIETSVTKAFSGGFRQSRPSQKEHVAAKAESTPTEAEYGVPLPLVEVGVSRLGKEKDLLKSKLTQIQYEVTQNKGTEPAFKNEYWDNKKIGMYVDVISGEPLFSSLDKFDSGCGWPSFSKPLQPEEVMEKKDLEHFMLRTEVISTKTQAHLGHVFNDGPTSTGLRYCINSAALRFIPIEDLEIEGYGEYVGLFK